MGFSTNQRLEMYQRIIINGFTLEKKEIKTFHLEKRGLKMLKRS